MYVYVGRITKAQGLKGQAVIRLENAENSQVIAGKSLYFKTNQEYRPFKVESLNIQHKNPLIKFEKIETRTELEKLIPCEVYLDRADFAEDGGIYLVDLIGAAVRDEQDQKLGTLSGYYQNGAQDIAIVTGDNHFEFPFVDQFIMDIDFEQKAIVIKKPEILE